MVNTLLWTLLATMLACPALALCINSILLRHKVLAARIATSFIGLGFLIAIMFLGVLSFSKSSSICFLLNLTTMTALLSSLVLFVSYIVHRFSLRYMDGDRLYSRYFSLLAALTVCAVIMVLADHLFLFWISWSLTNLLLVMLMVHKKEWLAARKSGFLSLYTLTSGSLYLLIAFLILSSASKTSSIAAICSNIDLISSDLLSVSMFFILIAGVTQSALWPFHRWLMSSLNSPTPVSALMHAGVVNGGGILIVKFSPLFILHEGILTVLFLLGAISAFLGTIWKLMQHDVKRMLACSTLAQMGFMMMQCGLGLFAAAIAHLCWHGLFKSYLFLNSGSVLSLKNAENRSSANGLIPIFISIPAGIMAMSCYGLMTNKVIFSLQTSSFIFFFVFIAGAQLMLTLIRKQLYFTRIVVGFVVASIAGLMYGTSTYLIELFLPDLTQQPLPDLSIVHLITMLFFAMSWIVFYFGLSRSFSQSTVWSWVYMTFLNAGQPSLQTITASRNDYHY